MFLFIRDVLLGLTFLILINTGLDLKFRESVSWCKSPALLIYDVFLVLIVVGVAQYFFGAGSASQKRDAVETSSG